jgi:hypothetical protein
LVPLPLRISIVPDILKVLPISEKLPEGKLYIFTAFVVELKLNEIFEY